MDKKTYISLGKYMDLLMDAICVVDQTGHFVFVSAGSEHVFGYTPDEMIGRRMMDFIHPDDRERTRQVVTRVESGVPEFHFENRYIHKNGDVADIMWTARWSEVDQCRVGVARNITKRKRQEAIQAAIYAISEAAHTSDDLTHVFEQIHTIIAGLIPVDRFVIALYHEARGELSFPYAMPFADMPPENLAENSPFTAVIRRGEAKRLAVTGDEMAAAEEGVAHRWMGAPLKSRLGIIGVLAVQVSEQSPGYQQQDLELLQYVSTQVATVIERKQIYARLQYLALYDPLTQLPNRGLFHDRMQWALARARRNKGFLSLLYLDLDKFKDVNDAYGHAVGDVLLEKVSRRLELCVRECDTISRFGGDEFVVLLEDITDLQQSEDLIKLIHNALMQPFELGDQQVVVGASIGVAHFPEDGNDEKQLLRRADESMFEQKRNKTAR